MLYFLLGLSCWVIVEYLMHRFVLHRQGDTSHKPHHENPKDISELFISWKYVAVVSVLFCGFWLIFFPASQVLLIYLGVILGYAMYETVHYRVHHCKAKNRMMKYLRKHHLQHHFTKDECNYSIVFPPIDYMFRTARRTKSQEQGDIPQSLA